MPPEKISRTFAESLQRLLTGEVLNASAFGNKRQLERLIDDRAVLRLVVGRNRARIRCADPEALRNYLRLQFGIRDLSIYLQQKNNEERDGEDSLAATSSTKSLRRKTLQGFFIKSFADGVTVNGAPLELLPDGVESFAHDIAGLHVPESVLVVGVENPECFVKAARLLDLFPQRELLFVLRYYSKSEVRWLKTVPNPYLHFGDFDPAGIAIYRNEFLAELGNERCRFFVPEQIEALIQNGDSELYDSQRHLLPSEEVEQPELARLIKLLERYGKGAEQEELLVFG